jgi:dTDP-4-dehydrorhamnose 3,5-epimerase
VTRGRVWDVAVDLRPGSTTFGEHFGLELSAENRRMFWVPAGFAHGFLALEEGTELQYKCTAEYHPASEGGIRWDDPDLAIDWPSKDVLVSDKDAVLPSFADFKRGLL